MGVSDFASSGDIAGFEQLSEWAAQDWREWAASAFIRDRTARIIVRRDLRVLAINARAMELISASNVLSVAGAQLRAAPELALASLRHAVKSASERESVKLFGPPDAGILLTARAASDAPTEPVSLALRDVSVKVEIDCPDLSDVFGLTPGERGVVLGLLQGQSPPEMAEETGRSVLTVRTHLKRAYAKIGVRSQPQLFARLLPLLRLAPK